MADITVAPTQDAVAESLVSDPQEQQVVEQPVTEQQPGVQEESQPVEQEQENQQEEVENWLPTEQDKIFPDEVLSRYCQRYGLDENMLANPQLKQLVIDKINTDIYLQQQQEFAEQNQETETVEEPTPEPPISREQHFANLDRMIAEHTDPQIAKDFHGQFMKVWELPAEQQPMAFTSLMSKYALNLFQTFMPQMLQSQLHDQIGQAFPGFGEMYANSSHAMEWDRVRNSSPEFADLPSYGTKEFSTKLREAAGRIPGFDEMQFTDNKGRPLPVMENSIRKYTMLAQSIKGRVDPQLLKNAVQAEARNTRRADVRRSAGNLGSGQSKTASGARSAPGKFQSNSDIFDEETMDRYKQEHGRL